MLDRNRSIVIQLFLGGITTQCELDGAFYGTANAETAAALLLAYNSQLINRLNKRQSYAEAQLEEVLQTIGNLTMENSKLKQENSNLSNYPWLVETTPSWFILLLVLTLALAGLSCLLVVKMKKARAM